MDVLIAFVTRTDPAENPKKPGPASTLTAIFGIRPKKIHLLYTQATQQNLGKLVERIREDPDFLHVPIHSHQLDLPDARDYSQLADLLPKKLREIKREDPGSAFHLVSGHPQVRMVMALCLSNYVLDGELLEVDDPDPNYPWPKTRNGYFRRLRKIDMKVINRFREYSQLYLQLQSARLKLDLEAQQAILDGRLLDLRKRKSKTIGDQEARHRTFELLVLLAAKKCYGTDPTVSKASIKQKIYSGLEASNIPKAINSINKAASKRLLKLIEVVGKGLYQLTDDLDPKTQIAFIGDVREYLVKTIGYTPTPEEFPYL